jgi:hypothetical protein
VPNDTDSPISKSIDGVRDGLREVARNLKPDGAINDLVKIQFDYAWKWFDFHARQRTSMFNFYVIVVAAVFGAIGALLREGYENAIIIVMFCIFGIVISAIFFRFDRRNIHLLSYGEVTLIWLEKNKFFPTKTEAVFFEGHMRKIGLLKQEYYKDNSAQADDPGFFGKPPKFETHSFLMKATYGFVSLILFVLAILVFVLRA